MQQATVSYPDLTRTFRLPISAPAARVYPASRAQLTVPLPVVHSEHRVVLYGVGEERVVVQRLGGPQHHQAHGGVALHAGGGRLGCQRVEAAHNLRHRTCVR